MPDVARGSGPDIEPHRDLPMPDVLELQRQACARAGSALYAHILDAMRDDVLAGGVCREILDPWSGNAMADAVPLRFLAAVHHLVLSGKAPELARYFPSAGGEDGGDPVPAFFATIQEHRATIEARMPLGVQTNEVGRAASLVGAFHLVARRTGMPLRVLEVGASGGLLLRWDHYGYRCSSSGWGPRDGVVFDDPWVDRVPILDAGLEVADRRGCDVAPIDPATDEGVARLRSFLWPDQIERRQRLDAAIAVARRVPAVVDEADAGAWVEDQLRDAVPGVATVVHHSIVLQYLPRPSFERMREAIRDAGRRATVEAPVHWLRMEPAGEVADVRLRTWAGRPGDPVEELLATTGYHGPPVTWLGP